MDEQALVRMAFGSSFDPSATEKARDIRVPGNVAVESKNGATFVYNGEIAGKILFEGRSLEPAVFAALGRPELVLVFCHYDSGGSFGYAIIKDGITVRSRVHTLDKTVDEGTPNAFELPWLTAESFIDEEGEPPAYRNLETGEVTSEPYVTAHLLVQVMNAFFGVVPWDEWDYRTKLNFYSRQPSEKTPSPPAAKAWWKFW
ncbi:hypothetical protein GTP91_03880 [Rugamonas sp. FT82W]|uniref:Uncharacterized protein n=1 Tax=Duganella vulcania TaxID=2692166 RepID=A0A845FZW5_9BURK|nr:hypothetical protein [Duganella vulcania]MYM86317.1 hypothetical protein [Duganella vulcania]